ncbi:hypothetical protein QAD02_003386 [Eretmocerus hayati]|uniref:Uncharacterized protein n=1 Tax=Eretmocerus hayati TaxID=131215 RepID=A0ACC2NM05_9HYME|nr:hypothetical protein QAD02_003386 [Eretmocerus hayati]
MSNLPQGWGDLSSSQQLGVLFTVIQNIQSSSSKADHALVSLTEKIDSLLVTVKVQSGRLDNLERENPLLQYELNALEESGVNSSLSSELKLTGIPSNCNTSQGVLSGVILEKLGVASLKDDVLETREIEPKNNKNVALKTRLGDPHRDTFSFVIKFKSKCVRHVCTIMCSN